MNGNNLNSWLQESVRFNRLVSHRGNQDGPNPKLENNPDYILSAAEKYRVEIDVRYSHGKFYLGHSDSQYNISKFFLFNEQFIIHAKDIETFLELERYSELNVFLHGSDEVVYSSKGNLIFHSKILKNLNDSPRNIYIDLEFKNYKSYFGNFNSLMTDFPELGINKSFSPIKLPFELLIIDIDGVMTNGRKSYGLDAKVLSKEFNDKDFTAIKRFVTQGVKVVFLSGDKNVNAKMAMSRGIPFFFAKDKSGDIDKSQFLNELKTVFKSQTVAYVGDDYYDITMLDSVDFAFVPSDAIAGLSNRFYRLKSRGGEGVIAELFDLIFGSISKKYAHDYIRQNE
jgi:YrbI family 3-deoxy-D-manno-octulosonate 8-phosphate phosphatase